VVEPLSLAVSGRIYRDAETGQYVSVIDGWEISACGPTIEETVARTWDLIDGHLEVAKKLGVLARELQRVGATPPTTPPERINVHAKLSVEGERQVVLLAS